MISLIFITKKWEYEWEYRNVRYAYITINMNVFEHP